MRFTYTPKRLMTWWHKSFCWLPRFIPGVGVVHFVWLDYVERRSVRDDWGHICYIYRLPEEK